MQGLVVQWLRHIFDVDETGVRFLAGPYYQAKSLILILQRTFIKLKFWKFDSEKFHECKQIINCNEWDFE